MTTRRELLLGSAALALGTTTWIGTASAFVAPDLPDGRSLPAWVTALLEARLYPWESGDHADLERLRASNPEWDLMSRTFLVMALADLCVRLPESRPRWLRAWDTILEDTLARVESEGQQTFLLPYAQARPWVGPGRSLFVDGEIAWMLGKRREVREDARWRDPHAASIGRVSEQLSGSPLGLAESYPDECWSFCNVFAASALQIHDTIEDRDSHAATIARTLGALRSLSTGLIPSSFTLDGRVGDGPEGSTLWLVAHLLRTLDTPLAREQYAIARASLGRTAAGFGWAREWPEGTKTRPDVDSGPIVPGVEASAGSSGLAILGAASFGDREYLRALLASLEMFGFPSETGGRRSYLASNAVGDAVLLAAMTTREDG